MKIKVIFALVSALATAVPAVALAVDPGGGPPSGVEDQSRGTSSGNSPDRPPPSGDSSLTDPRHLETARREIGAARVALIMGATVVGIRVVVIGVVPRARAGVG